MCPLWRGLAAVSLCLTPSLAFADEPPQAAPDATPAASMAVEREPGPLPALNWDEPVFCANLGSRRVRFQCNDGARTCLVADDSELDASGNPTQGELSRVHPVCPPGLLTVERMRGFKLAQAVAESPPGWVRDERNRVMQFNFDMHRRIWIGGGWSPAWFPGQGFESSGEAEFGGRIDFPDDDLQNMNRLHLLEGRLDPGQGYFGATALTWDISHVYPAAPLRFTTFFGKPRRYDVTLNVGAFVEAGHVESFSKGTPQTWVTVLAAEPTLDILRSKDLESYLRIRFGPALEHDSIGQQYLFGLEGGLDAEDILDRDGFHRLFVEANLARIWGLNNSPPVSRLQTEAGYEVILLAVNDQPVSAVLEGRAGWRDDLVSQPAGWDWGGYAGLRFSFWAPARRNATLVREAR
ncbi:MAG: hypothetical protein JST54_30670 [Deltaproteobacteria bacterium]|nr:hypothetical protein [Deltaproteobacteria bacterium]